ncbi:MAG: TIGR00730 family Rossman fold protein [Pseudomonadota bacterium]
MPYGTFSVCVYCGARDGNDPDYATAAEATGALFAARSWRLVYGAGDVGLMGRVARAAQAGGGPTLGVIPRHLMDLEVGKTDLDSLIVTETMHERKKVMLMNADAIVALPGGAGTLDELLEALTWRQLGLHEKPIYLLNTNDYWSILIDLLIGLTTHGFAGPELVAMLRVVPTPEALGEALAAVAPAGGRAVGPA